MLISVDIEAFRRRAERDHFDRLIWGRFPTTTAGIGTMMDIAEQHGFALTMLLEMCQQHLYGERVTDVATTIDRRGHDLQLHAHPGMLRSASLPDDTPIPPEDLRHVSADQADWLAGFMVNQYEQMIERSPVGFRGGSYFYNQNLMDSLIARGVIVDSSYNAGRPANQPGTFGVRRQFAWENGILELPISCVERFKGREKLTEFNFNGGSFPAVDDMFLFLDEFYRQRGPDAIAILVMHSWSFLHPVDSETGHFTRVRPEHIKRFEEFASGLVEGGYEVLTFRDLAKRPGAREELFSDTRRFSELVGFDGVSLEVRGREKRRQRKGGVV